MAEVFRPVQVVFTRWVSHFPDAHASGDVLQLAIAVDFAGQAIQGVVGKYQFDDVFPQPLNSVALGFDDHAIFNRGVAGSYGALACSSGSRNVHAANATGTECLQARCVAQGGNGSSALVSSDKLEYGLSGHHFPANAVEHCSRGLRAEEVGCCVFSLHRLNRLCCR
jgi:hypothetical protein